MGPGWGSEAGAGLQSSVFSRRSSANQPQQLSLNIFFVHPSQTSQLPAVTTYPSSDIPLNRGRNEWLLSRNQGLAKIHRVCSWYLFMHSQFSEGRIVRPDGSTEARSGFRSEQYRGGQRPLHGQGVSVVSAPCPWLDIRSRNPANNSRTARLRQPNRHPTASKFCRGNS